MTNFMRMTLELFDGFHPIIGVVVSSVLKVLLTFLKVDTVYWEIKIFEDWSLLRINFRGWPSVIIDNNGTMRFLHS